MSASISFSLASSTPRFFRCSYAVLPSKILSGLAKYIYSKTHGLTFFGGKGLILLSSLFSIKTISHFQLHEQISLLLYLMHMFQKLKHNYFSTFQLPVV